jgi:predicted transcriptional regulator
MRAACIELPSTQRDRSQSDCSIPPRGGLPLDKHQPLAPVASNDYDSAHGHARTADSRTGRNRRRALRSVGLEVRALNEAEAEAEREGWIDGDEILAWMRSWGTENELPPPEPRK